jgi:uncharacterized membrane protein YkvA (DUF1232 family)
MAPQSDNATPLDGEILPPEQFDQRKRHVEANFWTALKRVVRKVPFSTDLVAAYYCASDPATPLRVRITLYGALAYFILPIDAVPDFIFGIGFTDDLAVLALAIRVVSGAITEQHREAARRALADLPDRADRPAKII